MPMIMKKKTIPKKIRFRPELFWDVDPKTIDTKKHARYIIERILDYGKDREVQWMWGAYPHTIVRDIVKHSRVLHPQTRSLWQLLSNRK